MENPVNIHEASTTTNVAALPPKKKIPVQLMLGVAAMLILILGGGVAFFLSQQTQDIRQQASGLNDKYACDPKKQCCETTGCTLYVRE